MVRKPTDREYQEFNGLHCRRLWSQLSDEWRCPVCNRTKREIMIWGKRTGSNARIYGEKGFKCGIHRHHDHSGRSRFPETIICGACNSLDGRVKRKIETVKEFSFSPDELTLILKRALPNRGIKSIDVDFELANKLYQLVNKRG